MERGRAWISTAAALLMAAAPAAAATVTWPDGSQADLKAGNEVKGPAVVTGAEPGDSIRIRVGAVLRYLGRQEGTAGDAAENYFLVSGLADADVGIRTRIGTPAFWAHAKAQGRRAVFTAASTEREGYARNPAGAGLLRLVVASGTEGRREVHLLAGQGATVALVNRGVRLRTDVDNPSDLGEVRFYRPLSKDRLLDLYFPAGTEATVVDTEDRVLVASGLASARGKAGGFYVTSDGVAGPRGTLGPGVAISIRPDTGAVAAASDAEAETLSPLRLLVPEGVATGGTVPKGQAAVRVLSLRMENVGGRRRARLVLRNEGEFAFAGEVAFLCPPLKGNAAPWVPEFAPVETGPWKHGEERAFEVECPVARPREPLDVLLVGLPPADRPACADGTLLLGGLVRVARVATDLLGPKPSVEFVLQAAGHGPGGPAGGDLRWDLSLWRSGTAVAGATGVLRWPAGAGEKAVLLVELKESAFALVGARPVITLTK